MGRPAIKGPPVGELMTRQTLSTVIGAADAEQAAAGWGGDTSIRWERPDAAGEAPCVRTRYAMDTPHDLDELEAAFGRWAAAGPGRSVQRAGDRLGVTAC